MQKYQLGEFEEIVLLAVGILHGNAYGVTIKDEIEERLAREVRIAACLYTRDGVLKFLVKARRKKYS